MRGSGWASEQATAERGGGVPSVSWVFTRMSRDMDWAAGGRVRRAGACMLSTYNHHIHMRRLDKGSAGGATGRTLPGVARVIKRYSAYSAYSAAEHGSRFTITVGVTAAITT